MNPDVVLVEIEVTEHHIYGASSNVHDCPVARAVSGAVGCPVGVSLRGIHYNTQYAHLNVVLQIPPETQALIRHFDTTHFFPPGPIKVLVPKALAATLRKGKVLPPHYWPERCPVLVRPRMFASTGFCEIPEMTMETFTVDYSATFAEIDAKIARYFKPAKVQSIDTETDAAPPKVEDEELAIA